ncbi:MAG: hypothetical protein GX817_03070 [Elusimicrobia bacterium]|nr:hypothetical protein [Elusimicrobiota bacterium]
MTIPDDTDLADFNYNALIGVGFKGFALDLNLMKPFVKDSDMEMDLSISYRLFKEVAEDISLGVEVNLLSIGLTDGTNEDIQLFRNVSPMLCVELPF